MKKGGSKRPDEGAGPGWSWILLPVAAWPAAAYPVIARLFADTPSGGVELLGPLLAFALVGAGSGWALLRKLRWHPEPTRRTATVVFYVGIVPFTFIFAVLGLRGAAALPAVESLDLLGRLVVAPAAAGALGSLPTLLGLELLGGLIES